MSARFSTSPELHLTVGDSRLRKIVLFLFLSCQLASMWLLASSGYVLFAVLALILCVAACPAWLRDSSRGTALRWSRGRWSLEQGGAVHPVEVLPGSRCLPWVIYIPWRDARDGRRGGLWLYSDSVDRGTLRRLRGRLTLER